MPDVFSKTKRSEAADSAGAGLISSENLFGLPTLSYRPPSVTGLDEWPQPTALCACTVTDQFGM